jgi:hypothetical protein
VNVGVGVQVGGRVGRTKVLGKVAVGVLVVVGFSVGTICISGGLTLVELQAVMSQTAMANAASFMSRMSWYEVFLHFKLYPEKFYRTLKR